MNSTVVIDGDAGLVQDIGGDVGLTNLIGGEFAPLLIDGAVELTQGAGGEVSLVSSFADQFGAFSPIYTGPTTVTPSGQTQTLHTRDTVLTSDITVEPIPSNYGLVTWNGRTLKIS